MMLAVALMAVGLTSCGPDLDTPESAAESYVKACLDLDAEGMVACMGDSDGDELKESKVEDYIKDLQKTFDYISDKAKDKLSDVDFEIVDADEDGDDAKVEVKLTNGDGDKERAYIYLKKGSDDKWRVTGSRNLLW